MMVPCKATQAVRAALAHFNCHDRPVLVACSGGGDSVALALLVALNHDNTVILGFVQHHLRGNDSLLDAQSVILLAEYLSTRTRRNVIPQIVEAPLGSESGIGIEAKARTLRRTHLAAMAQANNAAAVFMGHTLDDQAETLLLRLIRGAGTSALGSIRKSSRLPDQIPLLRPLLSVERATLRTILIREKVPWREDASNLSTAFTRNLIRHQALKPLCERFGPTVVHHLARHATWLAEQGRRERLRFKAVLATCELPRAGPKVVLKLKELLAHKASIIASVVHYIWLRETWPAADLTRHHLIRLANHLIRQFPLPNLPGGIELRHDNHVVSLGPMFPPPSNTPINR